MKAKAMYLQPGTTASSREDKRPALLLLVHRIPFPPDKGDKIRSYHLLRYLQRHYRVQLGCFIDEPSDWQYVPALEALCDTLYVAKLSPHLARVRSLKSFLSGQPLTLAYYQHAGLAQWVIDTLGEQSIRHSVTFSACMAQFLPASAFGVDKHRHILDFVDVDSDKWRQYAAHKHWPFSWLFRREARLLERAEIQLAQRFDRSVFVSKPEAQLFQQLLVNSGAVSAGKAGRERIDYYNNGVDSDYFSPAADRVNPYPNNTTVLTFTGAMDYWPNVDAVCWFSEQILPKLRIEWPQLMFYIVGSRPSSKVLRLRHRPGVVVTGRVEDVRPYLQYAQACVAPMRVARGVQNKVLEAMAMARPVVATPAGLEGIVDSSVTPALEVLIANEAEAFIEQLKSLFAGDYPDMGQGARSRVLQSFSWQVNLDKLGRLLTQDLGQASEEEPSALPTEEPSVITSKETSAIIRVAQPLRESSRDLT